MVETFLTVTLYLTTSSPPYTNSVVVDKKPMGIEECIKGLQSVGKLTEKWLTWSNIKGYSVSCEVTDKEFRK